MFSDQARISVADSLHTLLIIIHGTSMSGRGILLLNASESEARIKHLDGFVSVSFFINQAHDTIGEYVQWRTPEHLAAAFRRPEFHEHLPVVESLASAEVGFYSVERVIASDSDSVVLGPSFAGTMDLQVLTLRGGDIDAALSRVVLWANAIKTGSKSLRAVVVLADRANGKAALVMHHDAAEAVSVWYLDPETSEVDRAERLMRYITIGAPGANDRPMRYVLSSIATRKIHDL
jgi:hypothetical protein